MTFDERYRAVTSRDRRFDGQFVMAVRTTGIYCRPSCPARTPHRRSVEFFPTSAAAHQAGYRACRRCLPEAVPGSPEWDARGDTIARAMRLIAHGVVDREGVAGLARRLGYSSRQLGRLLLAEVGAGPLALARAQRAQTARTLLIETSMPAAEVAFAAGFASVRQFNDTVREVFGLTPTALRARGARGAPPAEGSIVLTLPVREPFDAAGVFAWMAPRALDGVEEATERSFARTIGLPHGSAWFRVSHDGALRLEAHLCDVRDLGALVATVRRLFDLDADPLAVDGVLAEHPALAPLVARTPGIRVPGSADPHEMLMRAMIGQQISVAAARTHLERLAHALGERVQIGGEERILFPTAQQIADGGREVIAGPAKRVAAVVQAAEALAAGDLSLSPADDAVAMRRALLARPGIGPWTADYVRMRVVGDPDVLLPGDLVIRQGAARVGAPVEPLALARWAEPLAPWRSYASAHFWRHALEKGPR